MENTNIQQESLINPVINTPPVEPTTRLQKIVNFIKTKKNFIIAGGIASLLLILIVYLLLPKGSKAPPPMVVTPIVPVNSDYKNIPLGDISFSNNLSLPSLPSEIAIKRAVLQKINSQTVASFIANKLSIPESTSNKWYDQSNGKFLSINPQDESIVFVVDSYASSSAYQGLITSKDEAIQTAKTFVASVSQWQGYTSWDPEVEFLSGTGELTSKNITQSNASILGVPFYQRESDYPIKISDSVTPPLRVLVGPKNTLLKIESSQQKITVGEEVSKYKTLNIESIRSSLEKGEGQVIEMIPGNPVFTTPKEFTSITINSAFFEYRFQKSQGLLIPYYRLVGSAISKDQNSVIVNILLPAVELPSSGS